MREEMTDPAARPGSEPASGGTLTMFAPCATVFVASACVMVVELLAGRLIARYLGSSHYTWTSIIAVVLGGLAIGYYIGGRLADRYRAAPMLALLFCLSSAACLFTPAVNALVGDWQALWVLSWPRRIGVHVLLTFVLPASLMGTIGPVVAKMALDRRREVGRTVGSVYAWGAVGSIAGTLACGFYFIPHFGVTAILYTVAAVLALMAVLYGVRWWLPYAWLGAGALMLCLAAGPWGWARAGGETLGLRDELGPEILFHRESAYSEVRVISSAEPPGERVMLLDKLVHSKINVHKPDEILYGYERICTAVTAHVAEQRDDLRVLIFGGGGYTHPIRILERRPRSTVEVVEVDPVVTEAATATFGLRPEDPRLTIIHLDGRQHLTDLVRRKAAGDGARGFDFVFLDVFTDFNIPYHLATREFKELVSDVLSPGGVYLINLIDSLEAGQFLGAMLSTTRQVFEHTACYYSNDSGRGLETGERNTFVIVASHRDLHLERMERGVLADEVRALRLPDDQVAALILRSGGRVLTDDQAPVEYLLAGVVRQSGANAHELYYDHGNRLQAEGRLDEAAACFRRALALKGDFHLAHVNLGVVLVDQGRLTEALQCFREAARLRPGEPEPVQNIGGVLMLLHDYDGAVAAFRDCVRIKPDYANAHDSLGMALANLGHYEEARDAFEAALRADPDHAAAREHLEKLVSAMGE